MAKYIQGLYKPRNPGKYKGNVSNIFARSSWEYRVMNYLDVHPEVASWSSEELIIPYVDKTTGKQRRYFPDFMFTKTDGTTYLVEIKPFKETKPPVKKKQKPATYLREVLTWGTNSSKWEYATDYCRKRGWKFIIITEKDLKL